MAMSCRTRTHPLSLSKQPMHRPVREPLPRGDGGGSTRRLHPNPPHSCVHCSCRNASTAVKNSSGDSSHGVWPTPGAPTGGRRNQVCPLSASLHRRVGVRRAVNREDGGLDASGPVGIVPVRRERSAERGEQLGWPFVPVLTGVHLRPCGGLGPPIIGRSSRTRATSRQYRTGSVVGKPASSRSASRRRSAESGGEPRRSGTVDVSRRGAMGPICTTERTCSG